MQSWEAARVRREAAERDKSDAFKARIRMDLDTVHECLSETLMALEWPRETMLSYQIDVPRRRLWIDGDLPEIEYLPERSGSLCADGRRIIWRALFERAKREAYARHMHGIVLRVASVTFAALPSMRACFVRGFSQRTDPATGLVRDDYLLVVGFDRAGLAASTSRGSTLSIRCGPPKPSSCGVARRPPESLPRSCPSSPARSKLDDGA
jgi:hypothetical protein